MEIDTSFRHLGRARLAGIQLALIIAAAFSVTGILAAPTAAAGFTSGFGSGMQGWTCQICGSGVGSLVYSASGGNPGGHVTFVDGDSGSGESKSIFEAPSASAETSAAYFNGTLTFDLRLNGAADSDRGGFVVLEGLNDAFIASSQVPTTSWSSFTMPLTEAPYWQSLAALGQCTTFACMKSVPGLTRAKVKILLANLDGILIAADYQTASTEQTDLDNVALRPPSVATRTLTVGYTKLSMSSRAGSRPPWRAALQTSRSPYSASRQAPICDSGP